MKPDASPAAQEIVSQQISMVLTNRIRQGKIDVDIPEEIRRDGIGVRAKSFNRRVMHLKIDRHRRKELNREFLEDQRR